MIIARGFQEAGKRGEELHREIEKLAKENEIRMLGPNSLSLTNTSNNLIISFRYCQVKNMNVTNRRFVAHKSKFVMLSIPFMQRDWNAKRFDKSVQE